jgi:hypothetical protein
MPSPRARANCSQLGNRNKMTSKRTRTETRLRVNGSQLAKLLKRDKATITRLTAAGVLQRDEDGYYDRILNAERFATYEATKQQGHNITTASAAIRTLYTKERLRGVKLDNDIKERNLVPHTEVSQDAARCAVTLRATHNAVASELAPLLAGATLQAWEIERVIKEKLVNAERVLATSPFAKLTCPHCKKPFAQQTEPSAISQPQLPLEGTAT